MTQDQSSNSPGREWEYLRFRLRRFGLCLIGMTVCLLLYYLGFFGTYNGPLNPQNIGKFLDAYGVDKGYIAYFFIGLTIVLLIWNWILNTFNLFRGKKLTCQVVEDDCYCQAKIVKKRRVKKVNGRTGIEYVCSKGHTATLAHFHPVKKGPWSYCLCLAMDLISGLCIYWI